MKLFAIALAVLLIGGGACPAFADDPFNDQVMDVLSGRHDQCDTWGYVAYTFKDTVSVFGVPVLPKGLRIEASTMLGQDFLESNMVRIGLEL